MGQVLQGGEQRPNRMAHLSSFAARRSSGSHPLKTRASRECAELFSPFSSFDCDCQCCYFPIQRNRDNICTRKFDVEVFTHAGVPQGAARPGPARRQRGRAGRRGARGGAARLVASSQRHDSG
jgi:hypothetical protein